MEKPCRLARMSLIFIGLSKPLLAELSKKPLPLSTIDTTGRDPSAMLADASAAADLLPGFTLRRFTTAGAEINAAVGGEGPPLLLLHGNPLTHVRSDERRVGQACVRTCRSRWSTYH